MLVGPQPRPAGLTAQRGNLCRLRWLTGMFKVRKHQTQIFQDHCNGGIGIDALLVSKQHSVRELVSPRKRTVVNTANAAEKDAFF